MRGSYLVNVAVGCFVCLLVVIAGCCIQIGCGIPLAKCEKTVRLTEPLSAGSMLAVESRDGSIAVTGADVTDCNVTATIIARAGSQADAERLAEQTKVKLERSADKVACKIERPVTICNQSVTVNFNITVPRQSSLELSTGDGAVKVTNVTGELRAKTSDGSIAIEQIDGNINLQTSDGGIVCRNIKSDKLYLRTSDGSIKITEAFVKDGEARTSDGSIVCARMQGDSLNLKTSDGGVKVAESTYKGLKISTGDGKINCEEISAEHLNCHASDGSVYVQYAKKAPCILDVTITTSDGNISFAGPDGLSATIEASTSDGSISTELPITVTGKIGKTLKGTIGKGEGKVNLKTSDGSINIK
jgi:DUF4097 and DUF4098 domain-containing protein YvlB